jgi:hypothetical protein
VNDVLNQWKLYRTRFLSKAMQLTDGLIFIDDRGRDQRGQAGDYLVESSDGSRRVMPRAIFEDTYVEMYPASQPVEAVCWLGADKETRAAGTIGESVVQTSVQTGVQAVQAPDPEIKYNI